LEGVCGLIDWKNSIIRSIASRAVLSERKTCITEKCSF